VAGSEYSLPRMVGVADAETGEHITSGLGWTRRLGAAVLPTTM
jgi:hypothetical protein